MGESREITEQCQVRGGQEGGGSRHRSGEPRGEQVRKGEVPAVKDQQYKRVIEGEEFTSNGDGMNTS